MSITSAIRELVAQKKVDAKAAYTAALRAKEPPAKLLDLAERAGISNAQLESDVGVIDYFAELSVKAAALPAAEKTLADARKRSETAEARLQKIVGPLEAEAEAAGLALQQADADARAARQATAEAASLYRANPTLLDAKTAPSPIREKLAVEEQTVAAATARGAAIERGDAAKRRIRDAQGVIAKIESGAWALSNATINATAAAGGDATDIKAMRDEALASAQRDIAEAESELAAAEAAAKTLGAAL